MLINWVLMRMDRCLFMAYGGNQRKVILDVSQVQCVVGGCLNFYCLNDVCKMYLFEYQVSCFKCLNVRKGLANDPILVFFCMFWTSRSKLLWNPVVMCLMVKFRISVIPPGKDE